MSEPRRPRKVRAQEYRLADADPAGNRAQRRACRRLSAVQPSPPQILVTINPDIARDPARAHLRNPITIDHSLYPCSDCGQDTWIGPAQRQKAEAGGTALCIRCIDTKPRYLLLALQLHSGGAAVLNPGNDDRPRRWQPSAT